MSEIYTIVNKLTRETGLKLQDCLEVLELFFSSFPETKMMIQQGITFKDYHTIVKYTHQLKGTAENLRMSAVSGLATQLNSAAKNCSVEKCVHWIGNISYLVESLQTQLIAYKNNVKLKILIVEDDLISGKMLEGMIQQMDHHSLGIVSTAEQAFIQVRKEKPDLILMDISLSGEIDGIYTAELLSRYNILVAFISVHADAKTITHAKRYGMGYLVKPFGIKDIEEIVNSACIKHISLSNDDSNAITKIYIKSDNRILFIDFKDVIYFESQGHSVLVYTITGKFSIRKSLKELLKMDSSGLFLQVHRSFLVNRTQIELLICENYVYQLKLKSFVQTIPVSKQKVALIKTIFT